MTLRNICLIGLPSAGKTTIGKKLYQHLNKGFIDTDKIIQQRFSKPLPDLIKEHGEKKFLEMESHLNGIDLTKVTETSDETNLQDQAACAGGNCEIV